MGNIPLPALAIQPPQSSVDQIGKVLSLKSLLGEQAAQKQELQIKQQQITDQQAMTAAMKGADPSSPSFYDDVAKGVLTNGGSASAALAVQQHALGIKKTVSDIAAQDATSGSKNLETFINGHKAVGDQLEGVLGLPDDQLHDGANSAIAALQKNNVMDPRAAQQASQIVQSTTDPAQLRTRIDQFAKASMGAKAIAEQAKATSDAATSSANAFLKQNEAQVIKNWSADPGQVLGQVDSIVDPTGPNAALNLRTKSQVKFALGNGDVEGAKTALKAAAEQVGAIEKETNPLVQQGKIDVAGAEGQAKANLELQMARGSNAALANVPKNLIAPAEAAATKAGLDYDQAQSVTQRLQAMMDAAKRGNVVSYQILPEEGTLQITTSQGVHRINKTEIDQYAGGGSLWQRLEGHAGKALTGASIPASVLSDMAEIQKIQAEGSKNKYENSLKTINQNYGANFTPTATDTDKATGGFWSQFPEHK